jgi:predicted Rossmann fold nucleotide-binding protein DprA/Smf involved in DNA uptake
MERRKEEAVRSGVDPLLEALDVPRTIDQLAAATRLPLHELRARLTVLELQRRVRRSGAKFERA